MIVLTGASGGIGKDLVNFLSNLDDLIAIYNSKIPSTLKNTTKNNVYWEKLDLTNIQEINKFIEFNKDRFKNVTLINAAAISINSLAANISELEWDRTINSNLKGPFFLIQKLLPFMIRDNWGRVISLSSIVGRQGNIGTISYSTSKTALIGLTKVIAKEYARFGITANILNLGYFNAGLIENFSSKEKNEILNKIPNKMLGEVKDIFEVIKMLRKVSYVNGSEINIDGSI
jgi:3-oxoacyl-[acyl-carrier protein] reductase